MRMLPTLTVLCVLSGLVCAQTAPRIGGELRLVADDTPAPGDVSVPQSVDALPGDGTPVLVEAAHADTTLTSTFTRLADAYGDTLTIDSAHRIVGGVGAGLHTPDPARLLFEVPGARAALLHITASGAGDAGQGPQGQPYGMSFTFRLDDGASVVSDASSLPLPAWGYEEYALIRGGSTYGLQLDLAASYAGNPGASLSGETSVRLELLQVFDSQYGAGCAPFGGATPTLDVAGKPLPGEDWHLAVGGEPGGVLFVLAGFGAADLPMPSGCPLLVDPLGLLFLGPLVLPSAGDPPGQLGFSLSLPDTAPVGLTLALQAAVQQPLPYAGVAVSDGVAVTLR